jgi:hypothetical protein
MLWFWTGASVAGLQIMNSELQGRLASDITTAHLQKRLDKYQIMQGSEGL